MSEIVPEDEAGKNQLEDDDLDEVVGGMYVDSQPQSLVEGSRTLMSG